MWAKISRFILRNKLFLLLALLVATIFMANKAKDVLYSYEFMPLLPEDDPVYVEYQDFLNYFGQEGNVLIVGFQTDSLFVLDKFNAFYDLNNELEKVSGVEGVVSLLQAHNMVKNEKTKSFEFIPVCTERLESQSELIAVKEQIDSLPFYENLFYNSESNAYLMALTLNKSILAFSLIHMFSILRPKYPFWIISTLSPLSTIFTKHDSIAADPVPDTGIQKSLFV